MAAVLFIGAWTCAQAQSLGTAVADPLLGRPLEMSLAARFAPGDRNDECVQAEVFYGESRLRSADVRATILGPADQRRIRVEAAVPIDEPIVTVSVRAGCRSTITRSYTLLPQFPSEQRLAAADAHAAMAAATPVTALKLAQATATATAPAPRPRAGRGARKEVVAAGPRLRLEPLDMPARDALLRASSTLAQPAGDVSRRAAAAALWHALNADPQDVLRTTAMLRDLDRDLAQLRQDTNETRAEMVGLRARLDAAQPWRLAPAFAQGLLLLLLAAAGGAGVLLARTRRLRPAPVPEWTLPRERRSSQPARVVEPENAEALPPVVSEAGDARAAGDTAPAQAAAVPPDGDATLRVETLAALFDQVDFLTAMGLPGDAMDVLKAYLQDSASPLPLAYLVLMHLCEQAEDPAGVAAVRRRYAQTYGVEAPRLAQLARDGGIDALPELAGRITRAWHGPNALATLQAALFSVATPAAPVTLQAVRELLMLHDLAVAEEGAATLGGGLADAHALAPWADAADAQAMQAGFGELAQAGEDAHPGLDLDLGAARPAPLPEPQPAGRETAAMLDKLQADAALALAQRRQRELEEAFSAAVASERIPVSRY